jgi:two-component system OmpR family sensor kinase
MFQSLRFRLPALMLAGMALAGIITTGIAVKLYQVYTHNQSVSELRKEADGLTRLYAEQAQRANDEGKAAPDFAAAQLESATGDLLFYVGLPIFPGQKSGLRQLPYRSVNWPALQDGKVLTFEFTPPGFHKRYLAVANPLFLGGQGPPFGALVVATPKTELTNQWLTLLGLLSVSLLGGIAIAGGLAVYLSRRIVRPVLVLSNAADEVAEGNYDVEVPSVPGGGEIQHLSERFGQMASRLAEAERLERNFLMTVSHELRTPLTAIRGHVEALREGLAEDPESRDESLNVIAAESARLGRLVQDVLDLAKLDARRFTVLQEEVDMERLLDQAYTAFAEEAKRRRIDYRRDFDGHPVIVSDGDRVLQIISNLLSNAFKWTPDGGRVELTLAAENGNVSVAVDDTGPGIGAQEREHIFRPFWSKDGGGGTGLGLAVARELAVALGGRIELESEPGKGSRFELYLPNVAG